MGEEERPQSHEGDAADDATAESEAGLVEDLTVESEDAANVKGGAREDRRK